jgi:hypothetical protein
MRHFRRGRIHCVAFLRFLTSSRCIECLAFFNDLPDYRPRISGLESEDSLYNFISHGIKTNQEMHNLLEFVRWEYCSTDAMDDFLNLLSEHFCEINASMWARLCARFVLSNRTWKRFPPSVKKGEEFDVPDGIIAHLTRECGGNVHEPQVVEVTCGSFEKETWGTNPHSGAYDNHPNNAGKNAADLETNSRFTSACRGNWADIPHTRNNWLCYDFKEKRIVPTHYTIRAWYSVVQKSVPLT